MKTNTPQLRFPEFQGGWMLNRLDDIVTVINEKAGCKKYTLMSITSGIGLVSQIEKFGREIAGAQYRNYYVIRNDDFAYNKSSTKDYSAGFIALYSGVEEAAVPNSIFTCFRVCNNSIYPKYLSYLFEGNLHGKWLNKFIAVGARAHGSLNVDNKDLLSLPIPIPSGDSSLVEQQKIADCLTSLDQTIGAENGKLKAYQKHKKWLMQQLFPADGETVPRLRFPEFRNAPEWRKMKLDDLFKERKETGFCNVRLLSLTDKDGIVLQSESNRKDNSNADKSKYLRVCNGDIVYNTMRMWEGRCALTKIEGVVSPAYTICAPQKDAYGPFFAFYFKTNQVISLFEKYSQGLVKDTLNLKFEAFSKIYVLAPEFAEQQKIADCLSSLDELIAAQTQKIERLKIFKKGLMQQLFPANNEAEG